MSLAKNTTSVTQINKMYKSITCMSVQNSKCCHISDCNDDQFLLQPHVLSAMMVVFTVSLCYFLFFFRTTVALRCKPKSCLTRKKMLINSFFHITSGCYPHCSCLHTMDNFGYLSCNHFTENHLSPWK